MAINGQENIKTGSTPNSPTGSDTLFVAFKKIQNNFTRLFATSSNVVIVTAGDGINVATTSTPITTINNVSSFGNTVTITNKGVTYLNAGSGIVLSGNTGNVTITSTATGGGSGSNTTITSNSLTVTGSGTSQITINLPTVVPLAANVATNAQPNITSVGNLVSLRVTGNATFANNVSVAGVTSVSNVANLRVPGGTVGQFLRTDGSGNLTWANSSSTAGASGANGYIQFATSGVLNSNPGLTWNAIDGLNVAQPGIRTIGLTNNGVTTLGPVGNVRITGGSSGQVLTTNGAGNLAWSTVVGGGVSTAAGSNGHVQFNNNGALGGSTAFVFDNNTSRLTVTNLTVSSISGNGAQLSQVTGANVTGVVPAANVAGSANSVAGANVSGSVPLAAVVTTNAQPNITRLGTQTVLNVVGESTLTGNVNIGPLANIKLSDGSVGQVIERGATGLIWGNKGASTGGGTPGGSNTQIQFNNNGSFLGSPNLTFDGSNVTISGRVAASSVTGNGSALTGVATITTTIPAATTSPGNIGQLSFDVANNRMYVCVATNTWRQATLSTFGVAGLPATITTTSLPTATIGTSYTTTLAAAGDTPVTWSIVSGTLPTGLTLSTSGVITGTPSAGATPGVTSITFRATGATLPANDKVLSFTLIAAGTAPVITTTTLTGATTGVAYNAVLTATGTTPITWIIASGALPAGLTLNSTNGAIIGTPTASGTFSVTFRATNAIGFNDKAVGLTVASGTVPFINEAPLAGTNETSTAWYIVSGVAFSRTIAATGTQPITWAVTSGALPTGLTLGASTGIVSGTSTALGGAAVTITATNAVGTDTYARTLNVGTAPAIATTTLSNATVGTPYNATLLATGSGTYTWTAATLPNGLSLSTAGVISGTPNAAGVITFNATVTTLYGTATKSLSITIAAASSTNVAPTITGPTTLSVGVLNQAYAATQFTATGTPSTFTWTASGLPAGMTMSTAGILSGTPIVGFNSNISVTASNGVLPNATRTLNLTVNAPPVITSTTLPGGVVGQQFNGTAAGFQLLATGSPTSWDVIPLVTPNITTTSVANGTASAAYGPVQLASDGTPPFTWSVSTGALPPGITLSAAGVLSGIPTTAGTYNFTVRSYNSDLTVADTQGLTIIIAVAANPGPVLTSAPTINVWRGA